MLPSVLETLSRHKTPIVAIVAGQGLAMIGVAVGTRIVTEYASAATFGTAKLVIGLIVFPMSLLIYPFSQFCMREYHDEAQAGNQARFLGFARRAQLGLAAGVAAMFVLGLLAYRAFQGEPSVFTCVAAGLLFIGEAALTLERSMMITMSRQVAASVVVALQHWGAPLLAVAALVWVGDSAASLVSAQALALCLLAAGAVALGGRESRAAADRSSADSARWLRGATSFVFPMLGMGVFGWVSSVGDRYIIGAELDVAEVGRYSALYGLVATPMAALGTMTARFLAPRFYSSAARAEAQRQRWLRWKMAGMGALVAVAALAFVALFGELAVSLLLAEEYRSGARPLLAWLVAGNGFLVISYAYETEAVARKTTAVLTLAPGLAAVTNVLVNLALIPRMGTLGAGVATCVGYAVYLATMIVVLERRRGTAAEGAAV